MTQDQFRDAIGSAFAAYLLASSGYAALVAKGILTIEEATSGIRNMIRIAECTSPLVAFSVPRLEDALAELQKGYLGTGLGTKNEAASGHHLES